MLKNTFVAVVKLASAFRAANRMFVLHSRLQCGFVIVAISLSGLRVRCCSGVVTPEGGNGTLLWLLFFDKEPLLARGVKAATACHAGKGQSA